MMASSPTAFASGSAELLEEELDFCFFGLVSESSYPVEMHRSGSVATLTTDDEPIQGATFEPLGQIDFFQKRLGGDEADGGGYSFQDGDTWGIFLTFNGCTYPYVGWPAVWEMLGVSIPPADCASGSLGQDLEYMAVKSRSLIHDFEYLEREFVGTLG